jgi:hypothetical protein
LADNRLTIVAQVEQALAYTNARLPTILKLMQVLHREKDAKLRPSFDVLAYALQRCAADVVQSQASSASQQTIVQHIVTVLHEAGWHLQDGAEHVLWQLVQRRVSAAAQTSRQ